MKLNGNLVFNSDATGELQNVFIERLATAPAFSAGQKGRVYFNTVDGLYYFNNGSIWSPFATGGNAAALQTEVDNTQASLGSAVNADGTYNGSSAFSGVPIISGATSLTNALTLLATNADLNNTLAELDDVSLGTLTSGQFLRWNGTAWVNHTLVAASLTDVTSTAAELNILDGATLSVTELNYVDGVTSPIQTQLDNKQPLDAGLTALAAFNTNGILVQTAENTFAGRSLVAPAAGFTILNADGVGGNPTFGLANDLAALEGLATTGYVVRTGDGTATTRSMVGTAGNIVIDHGAGATSDTVFNLAAITQANSGTFSKVTLDGFGRVTGNTPVVASDITGLVDSTYVNVSGDAMTGNLAMNTFEVIGLPATPTSSTSAVSKAYVDNLITTGAQWVSPIKNPDLVGISATVPATPIPSGLYVAYGGTYPQTWGSVTNVQSGDLMHLSQAGWERSGTLTPGTKMLAGVFTNGLDLDASEDLDTAGILVDDYVEWVGSAPGGGSDNPGLAVNWNFPVGRVGGYTVAVTSVTAATKTFVISGDVTKSFHAGNTFVYAGGTASAGTYEMQTVTYSAPNTTIVVYDTVPANSTGGTAEPEMRDGTTTLSSNKDDSHFGQTFLYNAGSNSWVQIAGPGVVDAGAGLAYTGTTLNINFGAGIVQLPTDEVGVHLFDASTSALILTTDGTARSTVTGAMLHLLLDSAGALQQTADGLRIGAGLVTNAMLQNGSGINLNADSGTIGPVALGGQLNILGTSVQGISTAWNNTTKTVTLTIQDAAYAAKGVASFDTNDFTVTAGAVSIKAGGVDNAQLAFSTIGVTGADASTDTVSLGETLVFADGGSHSTAARLVDSAVSANTVSLKVREATATLLGVASFAAADFSVTAGAVSLVAKGLDALTDVAVSGAVAGQTLIHNGTNFVNRPTYFLYVASSASTTHTVTHNLGQKFCNVTVVDSSDEVIIPQSITFTSASALTVTFNSSIECKVVVMGVNSAA